MHSAIVLCSIEKSGVEGSLYAFCDIVSIRTQYNENEFIILFHRAITLKYTRGEKA
jgi:hypothetical protein